MITAPPRSVPVSVDRAVVAVVSPAVAKTVGGGNCRPLAGGSKEGACGGLEAPVDCPLGVELVIVCVVLWLVVVCECDV